MTNGSTELKEAAGLTVGLDVSDTYTSFCMVDKEGNVIEEGRVRTTEPALARRFSVVAPCRIVLEVGTHSPWVSRLLTGFGHEVVVVDPRKLDLIAQNDRKTDRHDAATLALLGRLDVNLQLLRTVTHRSEELQEIGRAHV